MTSPALKLPINDQEEMYEVQFVPMRAITDTATSGSLQNDSASLRRELRIQRELVALQREASQRLEQISGTSDVVWRSSITDGTTQYMVAQMRYIREHAPPPTHWPPDLTRAEHERIRGRYHIRPQQSERETARKLKERLAGAGLRLSNPSRMRPTQTSRDVVAPPPDRTVYRRSVTDLIREDRDYD